MSNLILPAFGNNAVDAISRLGIETFIGRLVCGSKTKSNIPAPFRLMMKFAKKRGIIQAHLVEETIFRNIFLGQPMKRGSKSLEGLIHRRGVYRVGTDPR